MQAFHTFLGTNDMMAYLAMMAPRLVELRRVLKPTGSLYLHCDPTASHYLKLLLRCGFGTGELSQRNHLEAHNARSSVALPKRFAHATTSILFLPKTDGTVHSDQRLQYTTRRLRETLLHRGNDGRRVHDSDDLNQAGESGDRAEPRPTNY